MISFSTTLLALYLLLILNTSADDSNLTDPPFGQQGAVGFNSPSFTDDAIASTVNQPVLQHEADLPQLSDRLTENTKSLHETDGEKVNCAADSPQRSSRRLRKRQQNDFCSLQHHENHKLAPPSVKPGAGVERPRGSMGGPNEFIPDPMLDFKQSQLYGIPNSDLCPIPDMRVPMCTPYDQQFTSPAPFLVPSRFCMCIFFLYIYLYIYLPIQPMISLGSVSQKAFSWETSECIRIRILENLY